MDIFILGTLAVCFVVFALILRAALRGMAVAAFRERVDAVRGLLTDLRRQRDHAPG